MDMPIELSLNETAFNSSLYFCQFYHPEDAQCMYDMAFPPFKLTPGKIVSAIAIALLIIIALGGNILVCTAFFVYHRLRKTTNYFVISLALSDIVVATVAMPMWLSYEVTGWYTLPHWIDFQMLLSFWHWFDILAGVSSIANLTAISIDRCLSISMPLIHRTRMTKTIAIIMVLFAWIYSIVLASLSLIHFRYFTAVVASLGFFFPLLIIVVSYSMIYCQVKGGGYNEQDWNLERTIIIVISAFLVCWLPFFIFSVLYTYCFTCQFKPDQLPYIHSFVKWMHYLNSCCNPFIYGLFNLNFKNAFRSLLQHCFLLNKNDGNEATHKATNERKLSLKCQIMGIKRTLQLTRKSRGDSSLSSDVGIGSTSLTMTSSIACNANNGNALEFDADAPLINTEFDGKGLLTAQADVNNCNFHTVRNPDVSVDISPVSKHCEQQDDSPNISFLQSNESQESCV